MKPIFLIMSVLSNQIFNLKDLEVMFLLYCVCLSFVFQIFATFLLLLLLFGRGVSLFLFPLCQYDAVFYQFQTSTETNRPVSHTHTHTQSVHFFVGSCASSTSSGYSCRFRLEKICLNEFDQGTSHRSEWRSNRKSKRISIRLANY